MEMTPAVEVQPTVTPTKKKPWLFIIIAVLGLVIIVLGLWLFLRKPASKTAEIIPEINQEQPTIIPEKTTEQTEASVSLEILSPSDKAVVTSPSLVVMGKTVPNAEVSINELETKADADGVFSQKLTLDEGENSIFILANDQEGNFAEKELTVTYQIEE